MVELTGQAAENDCRIRIDRLRQDTGAHFRLIQRPDLFREGKVRQFLVAGVV